MTEQWSKIANPFGEDTLRLAPKDETRSRSLKERYGYIGSDLAFIAVDG